MNKKIAEAINILGLSSRSGGARPLSERSLSIRSLITLLEEKGIIWKNIILCQDATMQHRMEAGLRKYAPDKIIINYASYQAKVCCQDENCRMRNCNMRTKISLHMWISRKTSGRHLNY